MCERCQQLQQDNERLRWQLRCVLSVVAQAVSGLENIDGQAAAVLASRSGIAPRSWGMARGVRQVTGPALALLRNIGNCGG